jgi:hypothetical protein
MYIIPFSNIHHPTKAQDASGQAKRPQASHEGVGNRFILHRSTGRAQMGGRESNPGPPGREA